MAEADGHDWITLHRVQFAAPVSAHERAFPPVTGADCWRFCPGHTVGANGLPTHVSDVWGGLGIWPSRVAAGAVVADPRAAMPWLAEAVAQWHCLALPVAHRGAVNWRGALEDGTAIRPAPQDPGGQGGPLLVVTSAGFVSREPDQFPRIARFIAGVTEVMDWYATLPFNLRRDVFNGGFDGREGFTLTLWQDDDAMRDAAYHPGRHRNRMDESRDGSLMDHSSFTRLRALHSHGDWNGDPFCGLQAGGQPW